MDETVESGDGAYVGKESQLLAHGEQSLFGTHLGVGVVVELRVADGCEKHGVALHAETEGFFGEGVADLVDGVGSADCILVGQFVTELFTYGLGYGKSLFHDFRSDAVAGQNCQFKFHSVYFLFF